ncbi:MAG: VOC family protein [Thermoplasmata archaeon]|nr:VOC family protein [Thermoplasmata archaeon]
MSVAVVVSNRRKSVEWDTRTFGLDVREQSDDQGGHWVVVGRKGQSGGVHICQISEIDSSFPPEEGPTGILFRLPGDFRRSCAALKANGVRFTPPPRTETWGQWAMIADPDANEIMLVPA